MNTSGMSCKQRFWCLWAMQGRFTSPKSQKPDLSQLWRSLTDHFKVRPRRPAHKLSGPDLSIFLLVSAQKPSRTFLYVFVTFLCDFSITKLDHRQWSSQSKHQKWIKRQNRSDVSKSLHWEHQDPGYRHHHHPKSQHHHPKSSIFRFGLKTFWVTRLEV